MRIQSFTYKFVLIATFLLSISLHCQAQNELDGYLDDRIRQVENKISNLKNTIAQDEEELRQMINNNDSQTIIEQLNKELVVYRDDLSAAESELDYLRKQREEVLRQKAAMERNLQEAVERAVKEQQTKAQQSEQQKQPEQQKQTEQQKKKQQAENQKKAKQKAEQEAANRRKAEAAAEARRQEAERRRQIEEAERKKRGDEAYAKEMNRSKGATNRRHENIDSHAGDMGRISDIVAETNTSHTPVKAYTEEGYAESSNTTGNLNASDILAGARSSVQKTFDDVAKEDMAHYIVMHINEFLDEPIDNTTFCNYITEKVCDYYKVDKLAFQTGSVNQAMKDSILSGIKNYTNITNNTIRTTIDDWNNSKKAPKWHDLKNVMSNDQLISVINIMSASNRGELPTPIGQDSEYMYYMLPMSDEVARISLKKTGCMEIVKCDVKYNLKKSYVDFLSNQDNALSSWRSSFATPSFHRQFKIDNDGSAKGSHIDNAGNKQSYKIGKPELVFYSWGDVALQNDYSETDKTDFKKEQKTTLSIQISGIKREWNILSDDETQDSELSIDGKYVKIDKDNASVNAGRALAKTSANGEVSINYKEKELDSLKVEVSSELGYADHSMKNGTTKGENKNSMSYSYNGNEISYEQDGTTSKTQVIANIAGQTLGYSKTETYIGSDIETKQKVEANISVKYGVATAGLSAFRESTSTNDPQTDKVNEGLGGVFGISAGLFKASINANRSRSYNRRQIENDENEYINDLPSDIIGDLYSKKIEESLAKNKANGVPYADKKYEDPEFHTFNNYITTDDIRSYDIQMKEFVAEADTTDFEFPKSDFNEFRNCYEEEQTPTVIEQYEKTAAENEKAKSRKRRK